MDYSKLSDIEIDTMVSKICSPEFHRNYCNNPADAWMVILEHHIAVVPYRHTLPQAWPTAFGVISIFATEDANPLRAAMIVFLMMQGSANVQDNPA